MTNTAELKNTYFVDLDGTLIKKNSGSFSENPEPIQDVVDLVNDEYKKGSFVVITTERPLEMKQKTMQDLRTAGVRYNYLIMGIGTGARIIINDVESKSKEKRALSLNLITDKGLKK